MNQIMFNIFIQMFNMFNILDFFYFFEQSGDMGTPPTNAHTGIDRGFLQA